MPKLTEYEIKQARHADLAEYLRIHGYTLKKEGKSYRVQDYSGGMIVTGYKWYWQSENVGGKSIDFLTKVLHMPFRDAVQALNGVPVACDAYDAYDVPHAAVLEPVKLPEKANNDRRVIAYLCEKRHIHYDIVQHLLNNNKVYQDTRGNCVFAIYDDNGCPVGAESHGTGYTRYKASTRHTGYGFTLHCGSIQTGAMFFESSIDLLSYYQIYKSDLSHHDLVSIAGVGNYETIQLYHQMHPTNKICLCCDNDDAGNKLIAKMRAELDCEIYVHRPISNIHDWNDVLQPQSNIYNEPLNNNISLHK
ncbi:MAG: DUF3991 and toprim domain-containing protein [Oscillospiraceae bacterium]|nr:DUF3991 and toprim domain-containing protein [Oscillospiraceae bacterium]